MWWTTPEYKNDNKPASEEAWKAVKTLAVDELSNKKLYVVDGSILQLLCGLAVILAVLFQSGKSAGLSGAIGGVADTFMSKGKAKTFDAKLAKATKWIGAVFIVLTLVLNVMSVRG